jgi:hypothetical protein
MGKEVIVVKSKTDSCSPPGFLNKIEKDIHKILIPKLIKNCLPGILAALTKGTYCYSGSFLRRQLYSQLLLVS